MLTKPYGGGRSTSSDVSMPRSARVSRPATAVVVVAAGRGVRAVREGDAPKQYRALAGRSVLARTLAAFLGHPRVDRVVVTIHPDHADLYAAAVAEFAGDARLLPPVAGGDTRQASVRAGLEALAEGGCDRVLVHDAARPFVSPAVIDRALDGLDRADGTLPAVAVVDTLKRTDAEGRIVETIPRERIHRAQTPQGFRYPAIRAAHARAAEAGRDDFTDDAAVAEWAGLDVRVVEGDPANLKLTTNEDFAMAQTRMTLDRFAALPDVRVGQGYDVHAFAPGDAVTLCGVKIPHSARLDGHSDADVALHALTDAVLGALGDGDIGAHFPPSEARWRGADSALFLEDALARLAARGGMLAHVDVTIVAEAPKIGPHREAMRARLAEICGCAIDRVGVKATTNEKLGFVGRREGIAVLAAATIRLPVPP